MDVQALYTSIPHGDGLTALKFFLDKRPDPNPATHTLIRLAELVLTLNTFEFDSEHFQQSNGVAMGNKMGPSYACLFVGHMEHQMFLQYDGVVPDLYKRYIDDIGGAASCSKPDLERFLQFVCAFHPALRYTVTISDSQLSLLDILLTVTGNKISTSVFFKETDSHSYLTYNSSHPPACKDSIPYSQFLRLRRLCSDQNDFDRQVTTMSDYFTQRGYPASVVAAAKDKISSVSRTDALSPAAPQHMRRVPLVLTYHPHNLAVKNIIYKNWSTLSGDTTIGDIFRDLPLLAFRRDKNLRDQLVTSRLKASNLSPGTYSCQRSRCNTCAYTYNPATLKGPSGSHRTLDHITCTTKNVVYAITCTNRHAIYVGQTGMRLANRFTKHLRSICLIDGQPVARHFNCPRHTIQHVQVSGLAALHGSTASSKNPEVRLILKLGTLVPNGMNSRQDISIG